MKTILLIMQDLKEAAQINYVFTGITFFAFLVLFVLDCTNQGIKI